jgi:hypothetical protein
MLVVPQGVGAYWVCIPLPQEMTPADLESEVTLILEYARTGVPLDDLKAEIANGVANRLHAKGWTDRDCGILAKAIQKLSADGGNVRATWVSILEPSC